VNQLGTDEYASQLTIQLLDHGFEQSLRSRFPSLAPTQQDAQHGFTHEDGETLMRYLVCQFGRLEDLIMGYFWVILVFLGYVVSMV
jgi:hypothetical protein